MPVRLLTGISESPTDKRNPDDIRALFTHLLPNTDESNWALDVRYIRYKSGFTAWNHSKTLIVGDRVVEGGINFWDPHYFSSGRSVFDVSVKSRGAGSATGYK